MKFQQSLLCAAVLSLLEGSMATSRAGGQITFDAHQPYTPQTNPDGPNLAGLLTVTNAVALFYDYVRSVSSPNERTMNGYQKTTFFAPSNPTIVHLVHKPHQGPVETDINVTSEKDEEKANFAYLTRWVESHAVEYALSPSDLRKDGSKGWTTMDGKTITVECDESQNTDGFEGCIVQPGNARIISHLEASNGEVYIIDGVLPVQD